MVIENASVKIMLSYDYCHFEVSLGLNDDTGITLEEIDNMRKNTQRLADKAVAQYKKAKEMAALRIEGKHQMYNFEKICEAIKSKKEEDRTIKETAMLKQYQDEDWQKQFDYEYDYEDIEQ